MDVWSPAQYLRFAAERRLPFDALVALCERRDGGQGVDLGCGTGELTRELPERLGLRHVLGVDLSEAMLARARGEGGEPTELSASQEPGAQTAEPSPLGEPSALPQTVTFAHGDLAQFTSAQPLDLVFSNAALHWVPDHASVLGHLRAQLAPGGQLAIQLPCNGDHPAYAAIDETVQEQHALFPGELPSVASIANVETPERYLSILHGLGASAVNVHMRVFPHVLAEPLHVLEWVRGTALHPFRVALPDDAAYAAFLASYEARLRRTLGPPAMPYLFTFKRIFLWARFDEPAALR
ncbi:MAG: methyltransferase domain-containing protein [Polyangiales bacterium]